jgi:hypothetical protein
MSREHERFRCNNKQMHRCSEHQTIRDAMKHTSALQKADGQQTSRNQRSAYEKNHGEILKKILLKFEEHAVPTI